MPSEAKARDAQLDRCGAARTLHNRAGSDVLLRVACG